MSEQATADWRGMEAGRELDRVVAERLGWQVKELVEDGERVCRLYNAQGVNVGVDYDLTIDEMWQIVLRQPATPYDLPAFSTDANAALALLIGSGSPWMLVEEPDNPFIRAFIGGRNDDPERMYYHAITDGAKTAALAIVRAWLAWKDAR